MSLIIQRITIVRTKRPDFHTINDQLQWLAGSLGMFNLRDKDKSQFRLFIELVKLSKSQDVISSDELALRCGLSRGTVVHHLNKLLESGLIISNKNRYELRVNTLYALIEEIEKDYLKVFKEMKHVAKDLDDRLGLH
ncbi:MAG: winged helix-turn-helix transcriptional regulator [Candidatus Woesearchaeota archaeon]